MHPGLIVAIIAFFIICFVIVVVSISKSGSKSSDSNRTTKEHKEPRQLSYKQQMYLNSLRGDETSPYSGAAYNISQSAYDAFSDFIQEVFS